MGKELSLKQFNDPSLRSSIAIEFQLPPVQAYTRTGVRDRNQAPGYYRSPWLDTVCQNEAHSFEIYWKIQSFVRSFFSIHFREPEAGQTDRAASAIRPYCGSNVRSHHVAQQVGVRCYRGLLSVAGLGPRVTGHFKTSHERSN